MRRRAAILLLLFFLPAGFRFAAVSAPSAPAFCPLKCPHGGEAMSGDCCPTGQERGSACSVRSCHGEEAPGVVNPLPGQPLILAEVANLPAPVRCGLAAAPFDRDEPSPPRRAPDHIPLRPV